MSLLKGPKGRFGRLQRQCDRAFIVHGGVATTQQLASWCYPREIMWGERLKRWQIDNQARAAKSIGARPMERVGAQRVWRLPHCQIYKTLKF
jgi:hypothetical protein